MTNPNSTSIWRSGSDEPAKPAGCTPGTAPALSILYTDPQRSVKLSKDAPPQPPYFIDLNLDQAVDAILATSQEYNLLGVFRDPLHRREDVEYRHDVFRDLEDELLLQAFKAFAVEMRAMRKNLTQAEKLHYPYQQKRWHIEAVLVYCSAVSALEQALDASAAKSYAIGSCLRNYLTAYVDSLPFKKLSKDVGKLLAELDAITYDIHIDGGTLNVSHYKNEADYSAAIEATFQKFRQGVVSENGK